MIKVDIKWECSVDQYRQLNEIMGVLEEPPEGLAQHTASHDGTNILVSDVWDSQASVDAFMQNQLMPAVQEIGLTTQPEVRTFELVGAVMGDEYIPDF